MDARQAISDITNMLPDHRVEQLLDFARFLSLGDERIEWQRFGKSQLAKLYTDDEPEYTAADLRKTGKS